MSRGKPTFKQNDIRRAFVAAQRSPVRVRSVDFTGPDGTRLSFVLDNSGKADTAINADENPWLEGIEQK